MGGKMATLKLTGISIPENASQLLTPKGMSL